MSTASNSRRIQPLSRPPNARIEVPGSKSITNRVLVIAALANAESTLNGALFSDDTRFMAAALRQLGFAVAEHASERRFVVGGRGGSIPAQQAEIFVGNAGTAARFLPVMMALGNGEYRLDGVERMRQRPLGPLVSALREAGVSRLDTGPFGGYPLELRAHGLRGGRVRVEADASSQFASGLLLAGPYMHDGLTLSLDGKIVSRPYLDMTCALMRRFGVEVERPDARTFRVAPGRYTGGVYDIEPDASAASYFFAAAAISGGSVEVAGLGRDSLQGDLAFVDVLERMGCRVERRDDAMRVSGPTTRLMGIDIDMSDFSDVAQTLAIVATFAATPTRIRGIGFIRNKETDRIGAVVRELGARGIRCEEQADGLLVHPGAAQPGTVKTYDDHRMAMSFALLGLVHAGVEIADPGCTAKTFPDFFAQLDRLHEPPGTSVESNLE